MGGRPAPSQWEWGSARLASWGANRNYCVVLSGSVEVDAVVTEARRVLGVTGDECCGNRCVHAQFGSLSPLVGAPRTERGLW